MTFNEKVQEMMNKLFELISKTEITYLKDLDQRITINKYGKFSYYKNQEFRNQSKIFNFLSELEDNTVYTVIPMISCNDNSDEPYIVLSKQLLVSNQSDHLVIWKYINNKIIDTTHLYNINELNGILVLKYKKVKVDFLENNSFR